MKAILLIGYMCVGKTTLGRAVAKQMGLRFYDLDWYIEERYHTTVADIFATKGEAGFRDIEQRMLHEVAEFEDIVLACGGGTPTFADNMAYMNSVAHTVYLDASPETILAHLAMGRSNRPLLAGKTEDELATFVTEQLQTRRPYYEQAHLRQPIHLLDGFDKVDAIAQQIATLVRQREATQTPNTPS